MGLNTPRIHPCLGSCTHNSEEEQEERKERPEEVVRTTQGEQSCDGASQADPTAKEGELTLWDDGFYHIKPFFFHIKLSFLPY